MISIFEKIFNDFSNSTKIFSDDASTSDKCSIKGQVLQILRIR